MTAEQGSDAGHEPDEAAGGRRAGARAGLVAGVAWTLVAAAAAAEPQRGPTGREKDRRIEWVRPAGPERVGLEAWRSGVGAAEVWSPPASAPPAPADELVVVSWNTNVGGGALPRLLADLRRGSLTQGTTVEHFVLLLQEAHRRGGAVPPAPPAGARTARALRPEAPDGLRLGIDELARREGLFLYYVPSMRNGGRRDAPEDRGNAILATLPLEGLRALELPLERQRRVAIAAEIGGRTRSGAPWRLALVSLHLENRSSWTRFAHSFGAGRARQVRWLLDALDADAPLVLGGDFNSWAGGASEPAVRLARAWLPAPETPPAAPTHVFPLLSRPLDHMLYRLPSGARAETRVLDDAYGSDHRPLVGRVRLGGV